MGREGGVGGCVFVFVKGCLLSSEDAVFVDVVWNVHGLGGGS